MLPPKIKGCGHRSYKHDADDKTNKMFIIPSTNSFTTSTASAITRFEKVWIAI